MIWIFLLSVAVGGVVALYFIELVLQAQILGGLVFSKDERPEVVGYIENGKGPLEVSGKKEVPDYIVAEDAIYFYGEDKEALCVAMRWGFMPPLMFFPHSYVILTKDVGGKSAVVFPFSELHRYFSSVINGTYTPKSGEVDTELSFSEIVREIERRKKNNI
jgi:hypothetical protein